MKKNLLFAFIIFTVTVNAQTSVYHPFADSGAVWVMRWTNACTIMPCILNCTSNYQYRIDGDTIISGNTYKKVMKEGYSVNYCNCIMNVPSCAGATYSSSFYIGIRDDVPNRKSYINDGINPEELFFDFSLNVGDSIHNRYCNQHIIYIDSVQVGSDYRKQYMVSGNAVVIEGIGYWDGGYYSGPFEGCGPCVCNDMWEFLCYRVNGVTLFGDTSCALVSSAPEIHSNHFSLTLSPNPVAGELTVSGVDLADKSEIEIYNVLGKKIYSHPIVNSPQQFNIEVSFLNPGIYFLQLKTHSGVISAKFVKSAGF